MVYPGEGFDPLAVLQRIRQTSPREIPRAGEVCELCNEPIADEHGHLVDLQSRNLMCACRGCYLLFASEGSGGGHFKSVPERYLSFPEFTLSPGQWDDFQIPVSVAFFFRRRFPLVICPFNTALHLYTRPDVEAFLVRSRPHQGGVECYIVPIDDCYELVGHLRRLWRGFDGGTEANAKLDSFFESVRTRAQ